MFNEKGVFKNFAKLTETHLWRSLFYNNVFNVFLITSFLKTPTQVFFCQFYEIFQNTFFTEYFGATALNRLDGQKIWLCVVDLF